MEVDGEVRQREILSKDERDLEQEGLRGKRYRATEREEMREKRKE